MFNLLGQKTTTYIASKVSSRVLLTKPQALKASDTIGMKLSPLLKDTIHIKNEEEHKRILSVCQEVLDEYSKLFPNLRSATKLLRASLHAKCDSAAKLFDCAGWDLARETEKMQKLIYNDPKLNSYHKRVFRQRELMIENRLGNCGEGSDQSQFIFAEKGIKTERFNVVYNSQNPEIYTSHSYRDHSFLVLNRNPNSNINNPKTWGKAIVYDAWHEKCMYVETAIETYKKDFKFDPKDDYFNFSLINRTEADGHADLMASIQGL